MFNCCISYPRTKGTKWNVPPTLNLLYFIHQIWPTSPSIISMHPLPSSKPGAYSIISPYRGWISSMVGPLIHDYQLLPIIFIQLVKCPWPNHTPNFFFNNNSVRPSPCKPHMSNMTEGLPPFHQECTLPFPQQLYITIHLLIQLQLQPFQSVHAHMVHDLLTLKLWESPHPCTTRFVVPAHHTVQKGYQPIGIPDRKGTFISRPYNS